VIGGKNTNGEEIEFKFLRGLLQLTLLYITTTKINCPFCSTGNRTLFHMICHQKLSGDLPTKISKHDTCNFN